MVRIGHDAILVPVVNSGVDNNRIAARCDLESDLRICNACILDFYKCKRTVVD